jgi:hypothetical protein
MNKDELIEWIIKNVDANVVPPDEGNGDALKFNMVYLVLDGGKTRYQYLPEQDEQLRMLYEKYGYDELGE